MTHAALRRAKMSNATMTPPRRVLLVDDNLDSVETLSMLLRVKGHDSRTAETGEQAIEIADEYQPHIVILDLSLPGIDGYEVAQRLRHRPYGPNLLLVALTGWSGKDIRNKAAEAGFDFHVVKPIDWQQLEQVLELRTKN